MARQLIASHIKVISVWEGNRIKRYIKTPKEGGKPKGLIENLRNHLSPANYKRRHKSTLKWQNKPNQLQKYSFTSESDASGENEV